MWHEICERPILHDDKVEKSAKEMFEELGYKYYENYNHSGCNSYIKKNSTLNFDEVEFRLDSKNFNITGWTNVDMKLLKAINQQCKELGWLNEHVY